MKEAARGYAIYEDNVIQVDLRWADWEGEAKVVKTSCPGYVKVGDVLDPFHWCIAIDTARHRAVEWCIANVEKHQRRLHEAEAQHKKSKASWSADDVTYRKVDVETAKERLRRARSNEPDAGPDTFMFAKEI